MNLLSASNLLGWPRRRFLAATGGLAIFSLVVLFFLYFFDEFDTAAFGVLAPEIRRSFGLSTSQFGLIVVLNVSIVLLAAVPIGFYGDRLPRTSLVVAGAVLAGLFSFGTGLAFGTFWLVVTRIGNGVGVVVNDPIHTSLLSDYYRPEDRPRVFAMHRNGPRLGDIAGPAVAGIMATVFGTWRAAFVVLIIPVLAMAALATRLRNPLRGESENADAAQIAADERPVPFDRAARMLFSVRTLRRQFIAWLFIGAGFIPLAFLVPLYYERVFHLSVLDRGMLVAAGGAAAFAGVQLGGRWTPGWISRGGLGEPLRWAGWSLMAVGPALFLVAVAPNVGVAIVAVLIAYFVGGIFWAPFLTAQAFVSPARVRSQSFSFGLLFIVAGVWLLYLDPVFGLASLPDHHGYRVGLAATVPFWLIGGLVLWSAGRLVADDAMRALDILTTTAELRRQRQELSQRSILTVRGVDVSYGPVQVLFGVNLDLADGEIIALLGTNGAGKSTLLRAICGQVPLQSGAIYFDGEEITGLEPEDSFALGLVQVPGGRGVFPGLTVRENLDIAAWGARRSREEGKAAIDEVLHLFPHLARRADQRAAVLSGGEQQMLTLGQAFIARPKLLMIDELSLGLAPIVVEELLGVVRRIHDEGTAVILVEQSVNVALTVAHRALFMEKGEIRFSGPTAELLHRDDILRAVFLSGAGTVAR
jgi:branched-chain amino acid transport system ATP-binding protein